MSQSKQDMLLREMARKYADAYGARLKEEARQLEESGATPITPRMDQRLRKATGIPAKKKSFKEYLGALAACLILVLVLPVAVQVMRNGSPASDSISGTAEGSVTAETEYVQDMDSASAFESPPMEEDASHSDLLTLEPPYELIPLSFALPANLSVAEAEQDLGQSIYYLEDRYLDDVVLTMERDGAHPLEHLIPVRIGSYTVHAASKDAYHLITFEKDDILYTLTCRYDINTLVELTEYII